MAEYSPVGVIGASSLVGRQLLRALNSRGYVPIAWTRQDVSHRWSSTPEEACEWRTLIPAPQIGDCSPIPSWVSVAPIWALSSYIPLMEAFGARRVVAVSSTSLMTKEDSSDVGEQVMARSLAMAEERLRSWAASAGIDCVVLRPTMIYGFGEDKNITQIVNFIDRFGFFPVLRPARGQRQPIHAADVAEACIGALSAGGCRTYIITGGESLEYSEMVRRIFKAMGRPNRIVPLPLWVFRSLGPLLKPFPRYRNWTLEIARRMNSDLVFDSGDALHDLRLAPREFELSPSDVRVHRKRGKLRALLRGESAGGAFRARGM